MSIPSETTTDNVKPVEVSNAEAAAETQKPKLPLDDKNNKRILISNLPLDATRVEIEDLCNRYGRVLNLQLRGGGKGNKKSNSSIVTFMTHQDAEFVIYRLSGKPFKGQELRANWAEPINKEEEAKRKEESQNRRAKNDDSKVKKKKKKVQGMSLINLTPKNAIGPSANAASLAKPPTEIQFQGWNQQPQQQQQQPQQQQQQQPQQQDEQNVLDQNGQQQGQPKRRQRPNKKRFNVILGQDQPQDQQQQEQGQGQQG